MTAQTPGTYTTRQAMEALGITARSAFHYLRNRYPKAFIVTHAGTGHDHPTLYNKEAIEHFILWRNQYTKG